MKPLILNLEKSNMYTMTFRIILGLMGAIYLFSGISEFAADGELTFFNIVNTILGLALVVGAILNPKFGGTVELTLNNDYIRIHEGEYLTRTAYWNRVKDIKLTALGIRITYKSGMPERFKLPFMNSDERDELKTGLKG